MADVNWRIIAFWAALWWFIYSAPTEGFLTHAFLPSPDTTSAERAEEL